MEPYYSDPHVTLHHGDCLDVLREFPDASVHAVVTDPPYGLGNPNPAYVTKALQRWATGDRDHVPDGAGFMGRAWDAFVPPPAVWDECLRILTPGGHMVVFAGPRTQDLMALSIRLAGFEIRDTISWIFAAGFPKSLDVGKAIDKAAGAEREVTSVRMGDVGIQGGNFANATKRGVIEQRDKPATDAAREWSGWGTALKPSFEPVIVARKPLSGTVASTVLQHGTGALNIDGCRVGTDVMRESRMTQAARGGILNANGRDIEHGNWQQKPNDNPAEHIGRWPPNVLLTHSPDCDRCCVEGCPVAELDAQTEVTTSAGGQNGSFRPIGAQPDVKPGFGDTGGASRFFPCFRWEAKANANERPRADGAAHATVKPVALMRWLVKLVTPPHGVVLDPFAGSGTTLQAARAENFDTIGIEREAEYLPLIRERLDRVGSPVYGDDSPWEAPKERQGSIFDLLGS